MRSWQARSPFHFAVLHPLPLLTGFLLSDSLPATAFLPYPLLWFFRPDLKPAPHIDTVPLIKTEHQHLTDVLSGTLRG